MLNSSINTIESLGQSAAPTKQHKVLRMVHNERMAGSVPAWVEADNTASAVHKIESALGSAIQNPQADNRNFSDVLDSAMAYSPQSAEGQMNNTSQEQEFGFGDLLDMINPLQHLPVVSYLYRSVTGDEIRPISQIVGGALFAGPLGAATGLINAIVEEETGKDMAGNAIALMLNGDVPEFKNVPTATQPDNPEQRLGTIMLAEQNNVPLPDPVYDQDIAAALLSFSDLKSDAAIKILREQPDQDPEQGVPIMQRKNWLSALPAREPITKL